VKETWNWEEEDLEKLITDRVQESKLLDYKRCAALDKRNPKSRSDISKDVSAFANSVGGTLVYGIVEENNLPTGIDVGFDPVAISREWLEQVIDSSIERRIEGIRIKQIELKRNSPGRVVYIVYIPESDRAPHMAEDHIFYRRYNFRSVPMKEYEVREAIRKSETPNLKLLLTLENTKLPYFAPDQDHSDAIKINILIKNESGTPATYAHVRLYLDEALDNHAVGAGFVFAGMERITNSEGIAVKVRCCTINWSSSSMMPIWNTLDFQLSHKPVDVFVPRGEGKYHISWKIHAPRMAVKQGFYYLSVEKTRVQLIRVE